MLSVTCLGRWDLVDTYLEAPDGERTPLLGENPRGLIYYGADRTVIAMLAGSDRSLPENPVPDAAAAQAWAGFFAYQGSMDPFWFQGAAYDPSIARSKVDRFHP